MSDQYRDLIEYESGTSNKILLFLLANKIPVLVFMLGFFFVCLAFFILRSGIFEKDEELQVVRNEDVTTDMGSSIFVEVSGSVRNPGVFKLKEGDRVGDAISLAGGYDGEVDRVWTEKYINRASKVVDGQKIYIPKTVEQSIPASANSSSGGVVAGFQTGNTPNSSININTASIEELESLWGIGRTTGQNIVDHRPYSKIDELLDQKIVKKNVYERIKDQISVY